MDDLLPDRPLNVGEFALAVALALIIPVAGTLVCLVALVVGARAKQWWMTAGLAFAVILSIVEIYVLLSLL